MLKLCLFWLFLLFTLFTPGVTWAQDLTIFGNAAGSVNKVTVDETTENVVHQGNEASITTDVASEAETGGNDINVITGNSYIQVEVENTANLDTLEIECCVINTEPPEDPGEEDPPPIGGDPDPTDNPDSNDNDSTSNSDDDSDDDPEYSLASVLGAEILPATGNFEFIKTISLCLGLIFLGTSLSRSGRPA